MSAQSVLIGVIGFYKRWISPLLPPACRFEPSCAEYAMEAVEIHGAWRGSGLALRRLLRCHPFCRGGFDPVPPPSPGRSDSERPIERVTVETDWHSMPRHGAD